MFSYLQTEEESVTTTARDLRVNWKNILKSKEILMKKDNEMSFFLEMKKYPILWGPYERT